MDCYDFVALSALDVILIGFPANQARARVYLHKVKSVESLTLLTLLMRALHWYHIYMQYASIISRFPNYLFTSYDKAMIPSLIHTYQNAMLICSST